MTHKNTKPGTGLLLTREQAMVYGQRGGWKKRDSTFCIEGQFVSQEELASILGISHRRACERLKRAQAKAGPVTWEALGRKT